jgi:hypothetical protein
LVAVLTVRLTHRKDEAGALPSESRSAALALRRATREAMHKLDLQLMLRQGSDFVGVVAGWREEGVP